MISARDLPRLKFGRIVRKSTFNVDKNRIDSESLI